MKLKFIAVLMALIAALPMWAKDNDTPIITFHTSLYDNVGATNAFHFYIGTKETTYIDVDFGFGKTEVEVEPAVFDSSASGINATVVTGSVGQDGIVKVYGDASMVDYLDLEGVYITTIDISQLTNLEILNLKHNELEALDLSMHSALQAVYLTDNPFDVTPLKIGGNKPDLTILEMSICGAIDQSFNLSDYPSIVSFDAYSTKDLRTLDTTGCPELLSLSIDCTSVPSLDLSNNQKLLILNVSETPIRQLDLSHTPYLTELYCSHAGSWMSEYKYDALDLSKLPLLQRLFCSSNNLTELNVSNNPSLTDIYCNENKLTSLDISNNPKIINLSIYNNYMDFTTMPLPRETFIDYIYYQKPLPVERSYPVGAEFDFSSKVILPDSETWFALFAKQYDEDGNSISVELPEDYYTFEGGKVKLLKSSTDSLFMAFANSLFPDYDLKTTNFMVKEAEDYGKDNRVVSMRVRPTTKQLAFAVGIRNASPENPKTFTVDFGDGTTKEFTTTTSGIPEQPNASGAVAVASSPMVIYVHEGDDLTGLGIGDVGLVSIDLTKAPAIEDLKIVKCQLSAIDMKYNKMLRNIDVSENNLQTIDLNGEYDFVDKYFLTSLKAASNKLVSVVPGLQSMKYVDLSDNQIEVINLLKASELEYLDLSNNKIQTVSIQDLEAVRHLDLSGNQLSEIIIPDYIDLDYFNLSQNCFPLSTLPKNPSATEYIYAPQKPWDLPVKAPTANLTMQLLNSETVFKWYKADGTPVTTDGIKQNNPGVFQLIDTELGKVYCTFTNPAFPDLNGENVYRTTDIEVAEMPTNIVCTLHTLADGIGELTIRAKRNNTPLYVDWEGNGALEEFMAGTVRATYSVNVHSGVDVKMYSYELESGLDVVAIGAGSLESIDASNMTELTCFSLFGSYLTPDKIGLPLSNGLTELTLSNSAIENLNFLKGKYPELQLLNISNSKLTECDFTEWKELKVIHVSNNSITSAVFDNPLVWELGITHNKLTDIDISGLPKLDQLWIFNNNLSTLDISGNPVLRILELSQNYFNFNTLPENRETFSRYIYWN
ncbi:MAG: hypothetical protein K2K94_02540, partial [Muribaculaceae bacterium]|nr:hypothetical protein [Muribaculaceae bacterium]